MNYKKQILSLAAISFVIYIVPALAVFQRMFILGECERIHYGDMQRCLFFVLLSGALSLFTAIILFFLVPLYFLKEGVYAAWKRFSLWYLPVVAVLILSAGGSGGNGFNPGYGMDKESLTFFFSGLYFLVSIVFIIIKTWKLRGK